MDLRNFIPSIVDTLRHCLSIRGAISVYFYWSEDDLEVREIEIAKGGLSPLRFNVRNRETPAAKATRKSKCLWVLGDCGVPI